MTAPAAAEPTGDAAVVAAVPPAAVPTPDAGTAGPVGDAPAGTPTTEPVAYTLALPDKSPLDPAVVARVTEFAKANGLTPEAAQGVLAQMDTELAATLTVLDAANKPGGTLYEARTQGWAKEALTAPDLGAGDKAKLDAVLVDAQAELAKAPPAIREFLVQSGYGSHPDAIRWLRDIHARTKEKPLVMGDKGAPPTKPKTMAERMYSTEPTGSPTN